MKFVIDYDQASAKDIFLKSITEAQSPWGKRRLKRFKVVNGKRYQLHATRGWKAA
jgi:hypothetical protein